MVEKKKDMWKPVVSKTNCIFDVEMKQMWVRIKATDSKQEKQIGE